MKYGVKVIFTYSVEPDNRKFYEESIYLVEAESFEDAYEKAEEYTRGFDLEHTNPKGQKVKTEKIDFVDCFLFHNMLSYSLKMILWRNSI